MLSHRPGAAFNAAELARSMGRFLGLRGRVSGRIGSFSGNLAGRVCSIMGLVCGSVRTARQDPKEPLEPKTL